MNSDWPLIKIDDLKAKNKGALAIGPFGSRMKSDCYVNSGIPVIRGTNLSSGPTFVGDFVYITREKADELRSCNVYKNDLVFPHRGSIGEVGIIQADERYVLSSSMMKLSCDTDKVNPEFLYYFFKSRLGKHELLKNASQVGTPGIGQPLTSLKAIELRLPPLYVQNYVAETLSSINKKIDANNSLNNTLEEMARAIFKSWFVDFDPVKAKMNGQQPVGMDEATAALFPEKLVESELGLIPEGWKLNTLSNLIQLTGGGTPKRSEETYWNGSIPWFSVKDVPSGSNVFVVDTEERITELGLQKSSTKLLPKGTTIITARGTVGKLALIGSDMCMNQSCYGIRGKDVGDYFNYFNLKEAVSTLQQNTHGAVFDTITTKTFDTYTIAFSGIELANKFDVIVSPFLQKIESNVRENIELSILRDTLLPKLLSGEVKLDTMEISGE
ncbi:restriction endonuclease subunit S [Marinomonas sp. CT5]|uniref:restriction endonuclease subunit S n=1 Tax=Marinomonas sp. CT5 TaxID=2066133 RepID=UPI001BB0B7EA|nr:restriction endonuclease subunit S [Marinomonas sp. CT5]QUX95669.1 restriction endonuclease subunit S [Marinomonas sp. CT5]